MNVQTYSIFLLSWNGTEGKTAILFLLPCLSSSEGQVRSNGPPLCHSPTSRELGNSNARLPIDLATSSSTTCPSAKISAEYDQGEDKSVTGMVKKNNDLREALGSPSRARHGRTVGGLEDTRASLSHLFSG